MENLKNKNISRYRKVLAAEIVKQLKTILLERQKQYNQVFYY